MLKSLTILAACYLLSGDAALKLPSYIKACSYNDPNFNQCAVEHGREAIPHLLNGDRKYGIPRLDPMYVEEVMVKESGITIKAVNFTIEGAKDADLKKASVDFDKQIISFDLNVPQAIFRGKYEMAGKLVALPISGKGDFNCTYIDLHVNYTTNYKLVRHKDGEVYATPTDYDLFFLPQHLDLHFNNLFNGNKLLGDAMNKFLNENWRLVLDEIGKPAYKALGLIVHEIVSNVAKKVPVKELFLDSPVIPDNVEDEVSP